MSDVRGLVIQSRLDYVEKISDNSTFQHLMQKLSETARQAIGEQVFPTNLYPFYLLQELDTAIGESISKSLEDIFQDVGKHYASVILDRYFYNYMESHSVQKFLAQMEKLYIYLWNFGSYSYHKSKNHSATVKMDYDEDIHKPYCWFMQSFLEEGIRMCGGKRARIEEEECMTEGGQPCVYHLSW